VRKWILLFLACWIAAPLAAQKTRSAPPAAPADATSVDSIIAALYESVSHPPDREPNWDRMRAICLPVGMFIPPKKANEDIFTVLDVDAFEERVKKGAAAMKEKGEASSTYEGRRAPSDEKPFVRGINSIQLVRDGRRWWIASVVWDSERADNPIPADYMKSVVPTEYLKKK